MDERKQMVNDLIAGSPQEAKRRERIEFEKDPYGGMPRSWFLSEEGNPDAAVHSTDVSEDLL